MKLLLFQTMSYVLWMMSCFVFRIFCACFFMFSGLSRLLCFCNRKDQEVGGVAGVVKKFRAQKVGAAPTQEVGALK